MENLFSQLSYDVYISISKNWHLRPVLWSRVTLCTKQIYVGINCKYSHQVMQVFCCILRNAVMIIREISGCFIKPVWFSSIEHKSMWRLHSSFTSTACREVMKVNDEGCFHSVLRLFLCSMEEIYNMKVNKRCQSCHLKLNCFKYLMFP